MISKSELLLVIDRFEDLAQQIEKKGFEEKALAVAAQADILSAKIQDFPKLKVKKLI